VRVRTITSRSPSGPELPDARVIQRDDPDYPQQLRDLPDPPARFWAVGRYDLARAPTIVAVVGTRESTPYGERVARELTRALARGGACVVSGLACGIDATAHRTTLDEGGATIAVLGTGVDVPYPVGHRTLHQTIAHSGLLIAESPPGTRAFKGCFPRRNRIIAALASVTIVVEGGLSSGALNTAHQALDLGRSVGAVPGPIDAPRSEGANRLIRDGATIITEVADAVALAGLTPPVRTPREFADPDAAAVWRALAAGPLDSDALCAASRLPAHRCLAAVTALELAGVIECPLTGVIRRR
jgi:DNA processing protein